MFFLHAWRAAGPFALEAFVLAENGPLYCLSKIFAVYGVFLALMSH